MIVEIDWRNVAVILADNVVKLSDMVKKAYPDKPEITEPLEEVEKRCAEMIATAVIQSAKK